MPKIINIITPEDSITRMSDKDQLKGSNLDLNACFQRQCYIPLMLNTFNMMWIMPTVTTINKNAKNFGIPVYTFQF